MTMLIFRIWFDPLVIIRRLFRYRIQQRSPLSRLRRCRTLQIVATTGGLTRRRSAGLRGGLGGGGEPSGYAGQVGGRNVGMKSGERQNKIHFARLQDGVGAQRWAGGGGDQLRRRADEVLRRGGRLSDDLAGGDGEVEVLYLATEVDNLDSVGGSDGGRWSAGNTATHFCVFSFVEFLSLRFESAFGFWEDKEEKGELL